MRFALLSLVLTATFGLAGCSSAPLAAPTGTALAMPAPQPPAAMRLYALQTGRMYSRAAFAFKGGRLGDERVFTAGAILIRHPAGTLLFDAGFGPGVEAHRKTSPWLLRVTTKYDHQTSVADQLTAAGIAPSSLTAVVLTHAHWDHVSGLETLPGSPVWVTRDELAFVRGDDASTALARQLGTTRYVAYDFPDGPHLGFARSRDVFGDGSVVLVPAPGHTPGSIVAFIATPDGKRYALIGDTAWQQEGVDLPAEKPWIVRQVDADRAATRAMLIRLHQIKAAMPGLIIVPAHDSRVWATLPRLAPSPAGG
ncbi:MAG: MBL fold metallo-hydrolase [Caulobacter sp.]|nr:MBL fold metallo-hydrolase [Caulobacter sp.]